MNPSGLSVRQGERSGRILSYLMAGRQAGRGPRGPRRELIGDLGGRTWERPAPQHLTPSSIPPTPRPRAPWAVVERADGSLLGDEEEKGM